MGLLNSVVGALSNDGSDSFTTIQDFYAKFNSPSKTWVDTIDTKNTFECTIEFFPTLKVNPTKVSTASKVLGLLASAGKKAVKNLANNLTGGLLNSIMTKDVNIKELKQNFEHFLSGDSQHTFMEYLVAANMLATKDDFVGESAGEITCPLILNLGYYIQNVTIPNLDLSITDSEETIMGKLPINGNVVAPDSHNLTLNILNTKLPLLERIFYPWMSEVTLPCWMYDSQPYTTATITIDMSKHADVKYVFYGCRPIHIQTYQPTQDRASSITRQVQFTFDFMSVQSNLKVNDSVESKILGTLGNLAGGVGGMF